MSAEGWQESPRRQAQGLQAAGLGLDPWLLGAILALLGIGLVMVGSASLSVAERELGSPFHYLQRQAVFVALGLVLAGGVLRVPLAWWQRLSVPLLLVAAILLVLVLIPGLGREVNGSARWLPLGPINFQASELAKLAVVLYLAGYLVRHGEAVRSSLGAFLRPMVLVAGVAALLLAEPNFGAAVVILATALGVMFLAGVRLWQFAILVILVGGVLAALAWSSPYRMERITSFLNPWADPYVSGFQLTQALIAFGRGEWLGVGLGDSVQKLLYLPEAHTDFVFAVLGEELGVVGTVGVVALFSLVVGRALGIAWRAHQAGHAFGGHMATGLALWLGLQAFINMGVNMGALPTKGLTLPLLSYGGSSIVITCMVVALLLRVDIETRFPRRRARW